MCHVYFDRGLKPRNGYFALRHGVRLVMRILPSFCRRDTRWQIRTKVTKVLTILKYYTGPRHSVVIFYSQHMEPLKVTEGSKFMEESTRLQDKPRDAQVWQRHLPAGGGTAPRQWVFEHIKIRYLKCLIIITLMIASAIILMVVTLCFSNFILI